MTRAPAHIVSVPYAWSIGTPGRSPVIGDTSAQLDQLPVSSGDERGKAEGGCGAGQEDAGVRLQKSTGEEEEEGV